MEPSGQIGSAESGIIHCKVPQYRKLETNIPRKELPVHSPNFDIHVSVSDWYIPMIDLPASYSAAGNMWTDPRSI